MGLGKAEYQDLFNAKGTAEKNYKIRERTSDFFGGDTAAIGVGIRSSCSHQRTPPPKTTPKPGRQARAATGGKRRRSALCASKANERFALRVTRT